MKLKTKTIEQLVDWIIRNRKGDAFRGDSPETLALSLNEDADWGNLLYVLDEDIHFIGVVTFIPDRMNKILFIKNILVTKHSALKIFAQHFELNFSGYALAGYRGNEQVKYNTPRLIHHILNMKGLE